MFFNTHVTDSKTSPLVQELLSCYSVETQQQLLAAFQTNIEGPPKLSGGSLETQGSFQTNIGGPPKLSGGSLETQGSFQTNIGGPPKLSGGSLETQGSFQTNIGGPSKISGGLQGSFQMGPPKYRGHFPEYGQNMQGPQGPSKWVRLNMQGTFLGPPNYAGHF